MRGYMLYTLYAVLTLYMLCVLYTSLMLCIVYTMHHRQDIVYRDKRAGANDRLLFCYLIVCGVLPNGHVLNAINHSASDTESGECTHNVAGRAIVRVFAELGLSVTRTLELLSG